MLILYKQHRICLNAPKGYTDDASFGAGYFINVKDNAGTFVRFTANGEEQIRLSSDNLKKLANMRCF